MGKENTIIDQPLDKGGEPDEGPEGEGDGAAPAAGAEADENEPQPGGEADPQRGEGAGEAGGVREEAEDGAGDAEGADDPLKGALARLETAEKELAALKGRPAEAPPAPKELSEEEWVKKEEEWGVGRNAIKQVASMHMSLFNHVNQMLDDRLGRFEVDSSLARLAHEPGFSDVNALRSGIDEFLQDVSPGRRSDPNVLKKAAIYARGLQAASRVNKARNSGERNRRIITKARPAAPSGGVRRPHSAALTPSQRSAAAFHPEGEEGYKRDLAARGKPIG